MDKAQILIKAGNNWFEFSKSKTGQLDYEGLYDSIDLPDVDGYQEIASSAYFSPSWYIYLEDEVNCNPKIYTAPGVDVSDKDVFAFLAHVGPLLAAVEAKDSLLAGELYLRRKKCFDKFAQLTQYIMEPLCAEILFSLAYGRLCNIDMDEISIIFDSAKKKLGYDPAKETLDQAFMRFFKENTVSIAASLSVIGDDAFANTFVSAFVVDENNPEYASVDGVFYDKAITTLINYPADKRDTLFEIPDSVTTIRKNAIEVTNTLEKIVIPAGVSEIEEDSIFWNYALVYIDVDENNKNYKSEDGVLYTADSKLLLSYPIASERTEYTVLEGCERICDHALSQASNLTELHIKEGLAEIGSYSVYSCANLAEAGLPKSLKTIDSSAFLCCDALTRIDFAGNNSDWKQVEIKEKNELLTDGSVQIYCAE